MIWAFTLDPQYESSKCVRFKPTHQKWCTSSRRVTPLAWTTGLQNRIGYLTFHKWHLQSCWTHRRLDGSLIWTLTNKTTKSLGFNGALQRFSTPYSQLCQFLTHRVGSDIPLPSQRFFWCWHLHTEFFVHKVPDIFSREKNDAERSWDHLGHRSSFSCLPRCHSRRKIDLEWTIITRYWP